MKKQVKRVLCTVLTVAVLASTAITAFAAGGDKFVDVEAGSWYKPYVDFVVEKNYFNGVSDTEFAPKGDMTRAMFMTVLARLENAKLDDNATTTFTDVPTGTWYTGAVAWGADKAIINGTSENQFSPNQSITRQEMAVIMDRYITYVQNHSNKIHKTPNPKITFVDADQIAAWAKDACNRCVNYGLIEGNENTEFMPTKTATRAEVSAVIYRLAWLIRGGGGGTGGGGGADSYTLTVNVTATPSDKSVTPVSLSLVGNFDEDDTMADVANTMTTGTNKNAIVNAVSSTGRYAEGYYVHYTDKYINGSAAKQASLKADWASLKSDAPFLALEKVAAPGYIAALYDVFDPAQFDVGGALIDAGTGKALSASDAYDKVQPNFVAASLNVLDNLDSSAATVQTQLFAASDLLVGNDPSESAAITQAIAQVLIDNGQNATVEDVYYAGNTSRTTDLTGEVTYTLKPGAAGYNFLSNQLKLADGDVIVLTATLAQD